VTESTPGVCGIPQDLSEIVRQLDQLHGGMVRCLTTDTPTPADALPARAEPRTISAMLHQQRLLLLALEQAIEAALAAGVAPEQLNVVITHIEESHHRCQQLLRRHIAELEQTMLALRKRQQHRTAYIAHSADVAKDVAALAKSAASRQMQDLDVGDSP